MYFLAILLISFTLNRLRVCWLITNLLFIGTPRQPLFYYKFILYLSQIALKKIDFFLIKYCCTQNIYYVKFRMINSFICVFIIYIFFLFWKVPFFTIFNLLCCNWFSIFYVDFVLTLRCRSFFKISYYIWYQNIILI